VACLAIRFCVGGCRTDHQTTAAEGGLPDGSYAGPPGAPRRGARHRSAGQPPDPLAPVPITSPTIPTPTTTSGTPISATVQKVVKLDIQVHVGPSGFPDRFGMASDLATVMEACEGGTAQVRMWAQVLGETWCWPPGSRSRQELDLLVGWLVGQGRRSRVRRGTAGQRTGSSCCRPASCPSPSGGGASWRWWVPPSPGSRTGRTAVGMAALPGRRTPVARCARNGTMSLMTWSLLSPAGRKSHRSEGCHRSALWQVRPSVHDRIGATTGLRSPPATA
jgi:hypothetical protein